MNKLILSLLGFLITFSEMASSQMVTININANVIDRSCTILNDSLNLTVDLQSGDLRQSSAGTPFAGKSFTISLIDCPANISAAHIKFTGESDITMGNLLKNLNETDIAAQGVALGLYDAENNNIDIQNNERTLIIDHDSSVNAFDFSVYYVKTSNSTSAGKILSVVDFELAYD